MTAVIPPKKTGHFVTKYVHLYMLTKWDSLPHLKYCYFSSICIFLIFKYYVVNQLWEYKNVIGKCCQKHSRVKSYLCLAPSIYNQ